MAPAVQRRTSLTRPLLTGLMLAGTVALGACTVEPAPEESTGSGGLPTTSAEGFVQAPLYLIALSGSYPPATTGYEVACQDLLVRSETVPVQTDDPAVAAIGFLLADDQYDHGDPPLTNSLDPSEDGLELVGLETSGDTVTVELSGELVTRSQCESYRIRAQLQSTAMANTGTSQAQILVNGQDLDEMLGLTPYSLGPEITTDDDGLVLLDNATPSAGVSDGTGGGGAGIGAGSPGAPATGPAASPSPTGG